MDLKALYKEFEKAKEDGQYHKLRKFAARNLTQAVCKDLQYLKDELQFLHFRYVDTEVKDNLHNTNTAITIGTHDVLIEENKILEQATKLLKAEIESSIKRAEEIITWRIEVEIERLIKSLT